MNQTHPHLPPHVHARYLLHQQATRWYHRISVETFSEHIRALDDRIALLVPNDDAERTAIHDAQHVLGETLERLRSSLDGSEPQDLVSNSDDLRPRQQTLASFVFYLGFARRVKGIAA